MAAAIINVRLVNVLISNQCHFDLRSKYQNWNGGQKLLGVPDFGPKTAYNSWSAYNRGPRIIIEV